MSGLDKSNMHDSTERITHMTEEEAQRYVDKNYQLIPVSEIRVPNAKLVECIDDRAKRTPDELRSGSLPLDAKHERRDSIAFPGGALCLSATILAAINSRLIFRWQALGSARAAEALNRFDFPKMMKFFEHKMNGMSCHTDDAHEADPLACAGCGHAMALLSTKDYGLGEQWTTSMREYAASLKERVNEPGITIYSYSGAHRPRAVLRILSDPKNGHLLSIPPNDGTDNVFTINEIEDLKILLDLASDFYTAFQDDFETLGVSRSELIAHTRSMYYTHVRLSAGKLAPALPVFDVEPTNGKIVVKPSRLKY